MEKYQSMSVQGELAYLCHRQAVEVDRMMDANCEPGKLLEAANLLLTLCRAKSAVDG